jgi:uncharacterized membrane protein YeaQ/YmgE (transglycosylase-associated protein family)
MAVFEFGIDMGFGGALLLILASLIFGVIAQFIGETRTGLEWLVDAVAFGIGALIASEFIVDWQATGPVWDGVALVPALIGGVVLGVIVEVVTRMATGGSYTGHHVAA